jgi:small ligand-binding sensory domain FIST
VTSFRYGHATHPDWRMATELALAQVDGQRGDPASASGGNLGFVYLTSELAASTSDVVELLKTRTGVDDWVGTVGDGIIATGAEYAGEPAIAVMLADLPDGGFSVFSGTQRPPAPDVRTPSGALASDAALVHADPATPDLQELVDDMAQKVSSGLLFGGIASGDAEPLPQVANRALSGGMSGVVFSSEVDLRSRVTQGCSPLAGEHVVSDCSSNLIRGLDGQPALDVLLADLGVEDRLRASRDGQALMRALPSERLREGLFVALAPSRAGSGPRVGFGDYLVRNLVGIDPQNRLLAVAGVPQAGDRAVFCTRDARAARADLIRICTELRDELESESLVARGGIYVSCVARGRALFGAPSAEVELIRANLGDIPLVGFVAGGEIAGDRLHAYTGVLTLFVEAALRE